MGKVTVKSRCLAGVDLAMHSYITSLRNALTGSTSVLDVGCGPDSVLQYVNIPYKVGIDVHKPSVIHAQKHATHHELFVMNGRDAYKHFGENSFDACVLLDTIEHLEKPDGVKLLSSHERIAAKRVIVFTPNGYTSNKDIKNPYNTHKSGWSVSDFTDRGYRVYGLFGLRMLRTGPGYRQRFKPRILFSILSRLSTVLFVKRNPQFAAALLAVKYLDKKRFSL